MKTDIAAIERNSWDTVNVLADVLDVSQESLDVQRNISAVQRQHLDVARDVRALTGRSVAVQEQQLAQALRVVGQLDLTNDHLQRIDASLKDVSGALVQQNALIRKSLNRLATESQELIERGMEAYANEWHKDAARDFEAALEKNPYSVIALYFLGKCYYHDDRPTESRHAYQKCIFVARKQSPLFECLALCDMALQSLEADEPAVARTHLEAAVACEEQDKVVLASTLLQCDLAEGTLRPQTCDFIAGAFSDPAVDPEMLLRVVSTRAASLKSGKLKTQFAEKQEQWRKAMQATLYERLLSHLYRELDDFVYLAPRIRKGFMESAEGKFTALGDPLADVLDWAVAIGERLLKRIDVFPQEYPAILRLYRPLQQWNSMLVRLNGLISAIAPKGDLVNGQFVGRLNLGLLELPRHYEDDNVLFEVNTQEGDTLALTCHYAIFTRNGIDHFPIPLSDYGMLRIDTATTSPTTKTVLVQDPRHGQTVIQGTTGFFRWKGSEERKFFIDSFLEVATLLARIHECLHWAGRHEDELFSTFLMLDAVAHKLGPPQAAPGSPRPAPQSADDEEFEII